MSFTHEKAQWLMKIRMWIPKGRIDLLLFPRASHTGVDQRLLITKPTNAWMNEENKSTDYPAAAHLPPAARYHKFRHPQDFDLLLLWPFRQTPQRSYELEWEHQKVQNCSERLISLENCKTGLFGKSSALKRQKQFPMGLFWAPVIVLLRVNMPLYDNSCGKGTCCLGDKTAESECEWEQ